MAQLEAERKDAAAVAALVAANLDVVDVNLAVPASVQNARTLHHKRCQLRINKAQLAWLFEEQEAEDGEAPEQHDDDAKEAHVDGSGFTPTSNDDEVGGPDTGVIELTSTGRSRI